MDKGHDSYYTNRTGDISMHSTITERFIAVESKTTDFLLFFSKITLIKLQSLSPQPGYMNIICLFESTIND